MRVLAFGDVHDEAWYYRDIEERIAEFKPELVIGVGDIVNYRRLVESLSKGGVRFEFVFVHGNNDNLEDVKARVKENSFFHYIDEEVMPVGGVRFFGVGGVMGVRSRNFSLSDLKKALVGVGEFDVLITHLDPGSSGGDVLTGFVRERRPRYWIHGHKHDDAGQIRRVGRTIVINASRPVIMDLQL